MLRSRFCLPLAVLSLALCASACGDDDGGPAPEVDSGADTGTQDAGEDSSDSDAGTDAGPTVSIIVSPTAGLRTTEGGGTDTFTVALSDEPTADVTIALVSNDPTEGTVAPQVLTFTPDNWNAPQTATVTGVDDSEADGEQTYTVSTVPAGSTDARYAGRVGPDVSIANTDDETAGITVSEISGSVGETGTTATFTIVLNSEPSADVMIGLSSSDAGEGTVGPTSLTFTVENWNAPQTVTVTGIDDSQADGDVTFSIVTAAAESADTEYDGLDADDVTATNVDNETANVTVSEISGATAEDGTTATFTVVLTSAPTADVLIGVSSADTTEGTVSTDVLTFTTENWNAPQTVTVTGVDDDLADGNQPYGIVLAAAESDDADYDGHEVGDVDAVNFDNDSPDVTVTAISGPTSESGGTATFTIVLRTEPTADVTFAISSSDDSEGDTDVDSITFTSQNWSAPQTVTVTGSDDSIADGDQVYSVAIGAAASDDEGYDGIDPADVAVTNDDDETPGITVSAISGDVNEDGASAELTIVLDSEPTHDVTINLTSDDTSEGTVGPVQLVFTALNWNAPQSVTVTGVNDDLDDGAQVFHVVTAAAVSDDTLYNGINAADVSVNNVDNDTAGITVSAISGNTTEGGASATFTVVLNSRPTDNVVIGLSSSNTAEGTVSPASLTFTVDNWNSQRTVTVTGVNDGSTDGDQTYTIVTAAAVSTDPAYSGLNASDVTVTNIDNETPGIIVSVVSGSTTEAGGTATLTVRLQSEPMADVMIALSSSDLTEGTVSPSGLTFTSLSWNAPQTVTITGVNDAVADGNQVYRVVTAPATSADPDYSGLNAVDRNVTNVDNDTAGITVSNATTDTNESGGTASVTIVLNSEPTANVTIGVSSSRTGEGTVAPMTVTFTPGTWNIQQTITITGIDDSAADGPQTFSVVTAPAISSDTRYSGLDARDVSVTNLDDDTAGFIVSPVSGDTTEDGGTATFTIRLTSQPSANVRVNLASSDLTEGTVLPAFVQFTPGNWNVTQTITVTGVDDTAADGNQPYFVRTQAATSADPGYSGLNPSDVSLVNVDNDNAVILVTAISNPTTESGGTATFLIALTTQPTTPVIIGISSSDTSEGTAAPVTVTFNVMNWNTPRSVTVTGVDDGDADGDVTYTIITAPAMSADPTYNGVNPANVTVVNEDDE